LGRHRARVPYGRLADARITNVARWTCLGAAVAVAASVIHTALPVLVDVALGTVAVLFALMTFLRGIEVTPDDGRSWSVVAQVDPSNEPDGGDLLRVSLPPTRTRGDIGALATALTSVRGRPSSDPYRALRARVPRWATNCCAPRGSPSGTRAAPSRSIS
jgi:hypothetical protein